MQRFVIAKIIIFTEYLKFPFQINNNSSNAAANPARMKAKFNGQTN